MTSIKIRIVQIVTNMPMAAIIRPITTLLITHLHSFQYYMPIKFDLHIFLRDEVERNTSIKYLHLAMSCIKILLPL